MDLIIYGYKLGNVIYDFNSSLIYLVHQITSIGLGLLLLNVKGKYPDVGFLNTTKMTRIVLTMIFVVFYVLLRFDTSVTVSRILK